MPRRKKEDFHPALGNGLFEMDGLILPPPMDLTTFEGWEHFSPMQKKYLRFRPFCDSDEDTCDAIGWKRTQWLLSRRGGGYNTKFNHAAGVVSMLDSRTQLLESYLIGKMATKFLLDVLEDKDGKMPDRMNAATKLIQMGKQARATGVARLKAVGQHTVVDPTQIEAL